MKDRAFLLGDIRKILTELIINFSMGKRMNIFLGNFTPLCQRPTGRFGQDFVSVGKIYYILSPTEN